MPAYREAYRNCIDDYRYCEQHADESARYARCREWKDEQCRKQADMVALYTGLGAVLVGGLIAEAVQALLPEAKREAAADAGERPGAEEPRASGLRYAVTHIQQEGSTCWQAAFMMAFGRAPIVTIEMIDMSKGEEGGLRDDALDLFGQVNDVKTYSGRTYSASEMRNLLADGPVLFTGEQWSGEVYLNTGEPIFYGHAVTVSGIEQDAEITGTTCIYVHDPAESEGPDPMTYEEFWMKYAQGGIVHILTR